MNKPARNTEWLPSFRRALAFLRPHRRPLVIGLLAAIGVSAFYTFSISSVVPLLKVIFADHESLTDWIHRIETDRRLNVAVTPDQEDSELGLAIGAVRPESRSAEALKSVKRITSINGQKLSAFGVLREIATHPDKDIEAVGVVTYDGEERTVRLKLRSYHWWSRPLRAIAAWLPSSKNPDGRYNTLAIVMALLVAISLLGGICRFVNEGLVALAVQQSIHDLRGQLADHVLRLPMEWHSGHPPGDTLGRFATDLSKVEVGVMTLFGKTIREPLKAVGVLTLTLMIDWKMLVIALLGVPIGAIVMAVFGRTVKRAQKRASQSWGRLIDHLGEKLAGIRVVKAYSMQVAEARRFDAEGRTLTKAQTSIELVDAATNPALESLAVFGVAAFVLYGGSRVFSGELEPHLFFAATICLGGIFDPVRKMGNVNNRLQAAEASAKRLFELIDLPTEDQMAAGGIELPPLRESIEFRGVSFAYPLHPERLVLNDVDLTVRRGQIVAVVGPNGSGKTTLVSLMLRFYSPARGAILIDGQDIAGVSLDSLRRQIGLVTQDSVVFSATVHANISYGAGEDVPREAVVDAARMAHVDDFIQTLRSPTGTGYDAAITARQLSGGQRQRLALARAILRNPPILVLDEATSQVDSESERKIQEALDDVTRDRTTFIIAHRYSTISRADLIVVLNEGRVVACGSHADLLVTCPFYVTLCETQFAPAG
jgi:ATP-binding cassette, subfamily B, bacterial MsbA